LRAVGEKQATYDAMKRDVEAAEKEALAAGSASAHAERLLRATQRTLAVAEDALRSARDSFIYHAVDAWIWGNAKAQLVNELKTELRRLVAGASLARPYRDLTDEEAMSFFEAGKRNIFAVARPAIDNADGLYQVQASMRTLLAHGEGYASEVARLAA